MSQHSTTVRKIQPPLEDAIESLGRPEDATLMVDALQSLQNVSCRSDLLQWTDGYLRDLIGFTSVACLLAEPHGRGYRIRDVIASADVSKCMDPLDADPGTGSIRPEQNGHRAHEVAILDASHALIDHWMRDRTALRMGITATRAQESDVRVSPLLRCFRVETLIVHGVKEAFGGSATFLIVGTDDAVPQDARPTLDVLNLVMPTLHVARQRIYRHERAQGVSPGHVGLTPRERRILTLIAQGATDEQTAAATGRSVHTVKNQVRHLIGKLGARNRTHAVLIAERHGLLSAATLDLDGCPDLANGAERLPG